MLIVAPVTLAGKTLGCLESRKTLDGIECVCERPGFNWWEVGTPGRPRSSPKTCSCQNNATISSENSLENPGISRSICNQIHVIYDIAKRVIGECLVCQKVNKHQIRKQVCGGRELAHRPFAKIQIDLHIRTQP